MSELAIFSIVPVEVWQDRRLTLEQIRVLGALLSFRSKNTDVVWPGREAIAERCGGMHVSNVSSATSALARLGWLEKQGRGGHSLSTKYRITVPEDIGTPIAESATSTLADSATVVDSATVADSATHPLADSATHPLADSATRKEETIELTNEQTKVRTSSQVRREPEAAAPRDDFLRDDESGQSQTRTRAGELCLILRPLGVTATPGHPDLIAWANGLAVSDDEAREAVARARQHKPAPQTIPMSYIAPILATLRSEKAHGGAPPRGGGKRGARERYLADMDAERKRLGLDGGNNDGNRTAERDITGESARVA